MITRRSAPSLVADVTVGELISLDDSTNSSDVTAGSVPCTTDDKVHQQPSIHKTVVKPSHIIHVNNTDTSQSLMDRQFLSSQRHQKPETITESQTLM